VPSRLDRAHGRSRGLGAIRELRLRPPSQTSKAFERALKSLYFHDRILSPQITILSSMDPGPGVKKERSAGYNPHGSILPEGYNARRLRKCRRRKRLLKGESNEPSYPLIRRPPLNRPSVLPEQLQLHPREVR